MAALPRGMKLGAFTVFAIAITSPLPAHALERDLSSVVTLEVHGGLHTPPPLHASYDGESDTDWGTFGLAAGLSAGIGVAPILGARVLFETVWIGYHVDVYDETYTSRMFQAALDIYGSTGDADRLLLRPFGGAGYGNLGGTSYVVIRAGADVLIPLGDEQDANGFLARAVLETDFGSGIRIGPMLLLEVGLAFDFL